MGGSIDGIPIISPEDALKKAEVVVITSQPGLQSIKKQLIESGVKNQNIITSYVDYELKARIEWLKSFSLMHQSDNIKLKCAEAGVFEGDFAKEINSIFPQRKLLLFDTFEGFNDSDIQKEKSDYAKTGDYSNTSVELVMDKMPYPDMVKIYKGYFPESARNVDGKFLFVNLDLDLYEPTLQGLNYFKNKMTKGSVILVHDYFSMTFDGPRRAVEEFISNDNNRLEAYPIGDRLSVMITGF